MDQFKKFIKKCVIFCGFFMAIGLQALHRPTLQQPMTPKLYKKMKPQARQTFEKTREEEELKKLAKDAQLEEETQIAKYQRSKHCYDLMMIIDADEQEKSSNPIQSQTMTYYFFSALLQENFPIIVSHNIVSNVCTEMIRVENNFLRDPTKLLASSINLSKWFCYDFPSANVMLFVPIKYLAQFSIAGKNIGPDIKNYGFQTKHLTSIHSHTPEELISIIAKNKTIPSQKTSIVDAIKSILRIPDKPNAPTWNIYLTGHGDLAGDIAGLKRNDFFKLLEVFQKIKCSYLHYSTCYSGGFNRNLVQNQLAQLNVNFIVSAKGINESLSINRMPTLKFNSPSDDIFFFVYTGEKNYTNFFAATESFFGNPAQFVEKKDGSELWQKDPIARILDTVITKKIETTENPLAYNQPFVYIPAVGVFNAVTIDKSVKIISKSTAKAYAFENKTMDFTNPALKTIIVYPNYIKSPLRIKSNVAIASPAAPSKEYKPTSPNKYTAIKIKLPLKFNLATSLVDPIQKALNSEDLELATLNFDGGTLHNYEKDVHFFEKITYEDSLCSLIAHCASLNKKTKPTIFVIKNLECFDYENSGLGNDYKNLIPIENMIIFTQLKAANNRTIIWETVGLFNFKQKTYGITGILEQENSETSNSRLFELFERSRAQDISHQITRQKIVVNTIDNKLLSKESHATSLGWIVNLFKSRIDTTIQSPGQKSLKDVLLEKKEMTEMADELF